MDPRMSSEHIFIIQLGIPAAMEAAFNDVYDNDHLPYILQIPGVNDCTRYKLHWSDNPDMLKYLAIYRLDDPELPRSAAWKTQGGKGKWPTEIRPHVTGRVNGGFRRIFHAAAPGAKAAADSLDSAFIYFLLQSVPAELDARFNTLYDGDHIPLMLQAPGANGVTRYKQLYSETGNLPDYLAVYAIDAVETPRSVAWKTQTSLGAWPTQMRPHFTVRRNGVFQRVSRILPR
jgi:hypothetical protein